MHWALCGSVLVCVCVCRLGKQSAQVNKAKHGGIDNEMSREKKKKNTKMNYERVRSHAASLINLMLNL